MNPEIAVATAEEIPRLCELLGLLFDQEAEFRPDPALQAEGLRRIIESPATGRILVARREGRVVGMVNLLFTVSTALGAPAALVEDMVVDPEWRGEGIGSQLLNEAIAARLSSLVRKVGLEEEVTVSGGCAKNRGLIIALEKKLGVKVKELDMDPQVIGALGAALIAGRRAVEGTEGK